MSMGAKPSQIWVHKGNELYSRLMKSWLEDNDEEIYSTHNEGKLVVAERLIRTLNNKIYKYMASVSKNVFIHKLDNIVQKIQSK